MNTYEALLRTACEQRDDPQPLNVLADWLEERGDPQADFIRSEPGRVIPYFADRFFGRLSDKCFFLGEYHLGDQGLMALARMEWVARLRHLDLTDNHITDAGLLALACSSGFSTLVRLSVTANPVTESGLFTLIHSLKTLGVIFACDNPQISYQGWKELAAISWPVVLDGRDELWGDREDSSSLYAWEEREDRPLYAPLERERPDKSKHHRPGRARRRWWAGFQVSQVQKQRRRGER